MISIYWVNEGEDNRTLSLAGAATRAKLDLDGDSNYTDPGEMDDTRVYNKANELQSRDVDTDSSVDYTLSHDAVGNLTDDGENNEYVYDAFGRLRFVNNQSQDPVSEYRYNGLNWRISVSHDTDADDDIDADDVIWYFVHDERWRILAVYREADANPKEQFDYHAAGQKGLGTASYIDDVILRDKDNSDDWEAAADDTLEERLYYCQNWRHDVIALIDAAGGGMQVEHQRYEAYGVPYLFVAGDVTANGTIDATDTNQIQTWIDTSAYDARGDLDLDNDVDATDKSLASANSGKGGGREILTTHTGNRKGYAGYEFDDSITHMSYHVRHRVLNSTLGQWTRTDPAGFVDSTNVYEYVGANPVSNTDPSGLITVTVTIGGSTVLLIIIAGIIIAAFLLLAGGQLLPTDIPDIDFSWPSWVQPAGPDVLPALPIEWEPFVPSLPAEPFGPLPIALRPAIPRPLEIPIPDWITDPNEIIRQLQCQLIFVSCLDLTWLREQSCMLWQGNAECEGLERELCVNHIRSEWLAGCAVAAALCMRGSDAPENYIPAYSDVCPDCECDLPPPCE